MAETKSITLNLREFNLTFQDGRNPENLSYYEIHAHLEALAHEIDEAHSKAVSKAYMRAVSMAGFKNAMREHEQDCVTLTIAIKMPTHCYECPLGQNERGCCLADKEQRSSADYRPYWCPLKEA